MISHLHNSSHTIINNMIFTDLSKDGLSAPVALHWTAQQTDNPMLEQLKAELLLERQKTKALVSELSILQHRSQYLESYLSLICNSQKSSMPHIKSWSSLGTAAESRGLNAVDSPRIGSYSPHTRASKIQHYKQKIQKYRTRVKVSRKFAGRSKVARHKRRVGGKFVKEE